MRKMWMDHYRVFSPDFFNAISGRWESRLADMEAATTGPYRVVNRGKNRFAVLGEPEDDDGLAEGVFTERQWALLLAATRGANYRERTLCLARDRDRDGRFPVRMRYLTGDADQVVGWMPYRQDRALEAMHVAEYILRSPHRLAHFLEAAGGNVLKQAAKLLARRLGLRDPTDKGKPTGAESGRVACRYRLEVITEDEFPDHVRPLMTGDQQASWLANVIPRSPIEIGGGLYLDPHYKPIGFTQYDGGYDRLQLEPRHIFAPALLVNAAYVSVWHTHPELDPRPGTVDRQWTRSIRTCGRVLQIPVLTSIVLGEIRHFPRGDSGGSPHWWTSTFGVVTEMRSRTPRQLWSSPQWVPSSSPGHCQTDRIS